MSAATTKDALATVRWMHFQFSGVPACTASDLLTGLLGRRTTELERVTCPDCRASVPFEYCSKGAVVLQVPRRVRVRR